MSTKLKILAAALIAGGTMFAQPRIAIGIGVGGYAPGYYAPPAYAYAPPCPGPGYAWVGGYWVPRGGRNVWINGYWRAPYVTGYYHSYRGHDRDDYRGHDRRGDWGHDRDRHDFRR